MRDTPKTAAAGPPAAAAAAAGGAPTVTVDAEAYAALLASNERLQRSLNAELRDPSKLREALGGALADALAREQQEKTMLIRENCELARQRWLLQQRAAALQPYQNHHHVYAAAAAATGAMPPGMSLDDDESIASSAGPMGVMPPLHAPPPPSALLAHHIEKVQRFTASQPQLDVGLGHDHSRPRTATSGGHAPGARALSRPRTAAAKGSQIEVRLPRARSAAGCRSPFTTAASAAFALPGRPPTAAPRSRPVSAMGRGYNNTYATPQSRSRALMAAGAPGAGGASAALLCQARPVMIPAALLGVVSA